MEVVLEVGDVEQVAALVEGHVPRELLSIASASGGLAGPGAYGRLAPSLGDLGIVRIGLIFEGLVHLVLASTQDRGWSQRP